MIITNYKSPHVVMEIDDACWGKHHDVEVQMKTNYQYFT